MSIPKFQYRDEILITGFALITTFFLWTNFDALVGSITFGMIALYWVALLAKNRHFQVIEIKSPNKSWTNTLIIGSILFVAWILIAGFIDANVSKTTFVAFDTTVFSKIAAQTQVPILSDDPIVRLVAYGINIPIAETLFFFGFAMVLISSVLKANGSFFSNPKYWWVAVLMGMIPAIFHFTVRRFSDTGLIMDFAFFAISGIVALWRKQLGEIMLLHIFNNSAVILSSN